MAWAIVLLAAGLLLLWKGADLLVNGAVGIAQRLGISQLAVGLTVVAMGTSAPEVAASIASALGGRGDIAIGNVYGSNIANLALIGGLVALINPLRIQAQTLRREIPTMLIAALLLWPILRDLSLSRIWPTCSPARRPHRGGAGPHGHKSMDSAKTSLNAFSLAISTYWISRVSAAAVALHSSLSRSICAPEAAALPTK